MHLVLVLWLRLLPDAAADADLLAQEMAQLRLQHKLATTNNANTTIPTKKETTELQPPTEPQKKAQQEIAHDPGHTKVGNVQPVPSPELVLLQQQQQQTTSHTQQNDKTPVWKDGTRQQQEHTLLTSVLTAAQTRQQEEPEKTRQEISSLQILVDTNRTGSGPHEPSDGAVPSHSTPQIEETRASGPNPPVAAAVENNVGSALKTLVACNWDLILLAFLVAVVLCWQRHIHTVKFLFAWEKGQPWQPTPQFTTTKEYHRKARISFLLALLSIFCLRFSIHQIPPSGVYPEAPVQTVLSKEGVAQIGASSLIGGIDNGNSRTNAADFMLSLQPKSKNASNPTNHQESMKHNVGIDEDDEVNAKPLLVLHVGPHKTATTTILKQLVLFRSAIFKSHNIAFLGICYRAWECHKRRRSMLPRYINPSIIRGMVESCFRHHSPPCNKNKHWKEFFGYMQRLKQLIQNKNTTFLLSEENFGLGDIKTMALFVSKLRQLFRVRVVLTYRNFFEWVPSWYYENYRSWSAGQLSNGFPPPFVDYWRHYGNQTTNNRYELPAWEEQVHPVTHLYNGWKPLVDEIVVFNMHNSRSGKDLLTSFLDTSFPEYSFDEDWKQEQQLKKPLPNSANPSQGFVYLHVTIAAVKEGLLDQKFLQHPEAFRKAVSGIEKHANEMGLGSFPQECLNATELQDLFEISENLAATVPGSEVFMDHNQSSSLFEQAVKKGKFCNVDAQKAVQIEELRNLIQSL